MGCKGEGQGKVEKIQIIEDLPSNVDNKGTQSGNTGIKYCLLSENRVAYLAKVQNGPPKIFIRTFGNNEQEEDREKTATIKSFEEFGIDSIQDIICTPYSDYYLLKAEDSKNSKKYLIVVDASPSTDPTRQVVSINSIPEDIGKVYSYVSGSELYYTYLHNSREFYTRLIDLKSYNFSIRLPSRPGSHNLTLKISNFNSTIQQKVAL